MPYSDKSERSSKWPPITTVLIASVLIAIVSCGGGFALDGAQNQLAGVLTVVGLFAILVAIISGFVAVVSGLFEHFKND